MRSESRSFEGVLATSERDAETRTLRSSGAKVTSWKTPAADVPDRVFTRIVPASIGALERIAGAMTGDGRPAAMLSTRVEEGTLVVEFDAARTAPELVTAVVDAEAAPPLFARRMPDHLPEPPSDAALAAFCAAVLGEPDLDTSRLIETYIEPMVLESP